MDPSTALALAQAVHSAIRVLSEQSNGHKLLELTGSLADLNKHMGEAERLAKFQDDAEWVSILGKLDSFYKKYNEIVPRYNKMSRFKRTLNYYQIRKEVHAIKEDLGEALEDIETANIGSKTRETEYAESTLRLAHLRSQNTTGMSSVQMQERQRHKLQWEIIVQEIVKDFRELCDELAEADDQTIKAQLTDHTIAAIVEAAGLEGISSVVVKGQGNQFLKVPERSDVKKQLRSEVGVAGGFKLCGGKSSPSVSVSRITADQQVGTYQPRAKMTERN